jgi:hypothetical protein
VAQFNSSSPGVTPPIRRKSVREQGFPQHGVSNVTDKLNGIPARNPLELTLSDFALPQHPVPSPLSVSLHQSRHQKSGSCYGDHADVVLLAEVLGGIGDFDRCYLLVQQRLNALKRITEGSALAKMPSGKAPSVATG